MQNEHISHQQSYYSFQKAVFVCALHAPSGECYEYNPAPTITTTIEVRTLPSPAPPRKCSTLNNPHDRQCHIPCPASSLRKEGVE